MADLRHTLDKETRKRHFPEMDGGKGDKPRPSDKDSRQRFKDNYDRIFRKPSSTGDH